MDSEQYTRLFDKLEELHGDFREFKGSTAVRVEHLEKEASTDRMWGRIQTIAVLPIMTALHMVGQKYHLIK